jgi:hypothetical protein
VNTAVGNKAEKVEAAATGARVLHGGDERWVGEEVSVLDHQIDARDVHVHDAASADVQVADFTVAHLAFGKSDERAAGVDQRVWVFAQ